MPDRNFDLSSATGRKAVEANGSLHLTPEQALVAALAVLMDPTCPTCEGKAVVDIDPYRSDPGPDYDVCPSCNGTGQNPDQRVKLSEVVKQIKEWPASMDYPLSVTQRECVAGALERWARERPDA